MIFFVLFVRFVVHIIPSFQSNGIGSINLAILIYDGKCSYDLQSGSYGLLDDSYGWFGGFYHRFRDSYDKSNDSYEQFNSSYYRFYDSYKKSYLQYCRIKSPAAAYPIS